MNGLFNSRGDTTRESARGPVYRLQPASEDAGHVLDEEKGKSRGIPTDYQRNAILAPNSRPLTCQLFRECVFLLNGVE